MNYHEQHLCVTRLVAHAARTMVVLALLGIVACGSRSPLRRADAGPDAGEGGGGGSGGSTAGTGGASCPDVCKPPENPCDFATCDATNRCLTGHMPKGTDCGPMMTCDGFGTCGPEPMCFGASDCDDGNPCTIDTCYTMTGTCGHGSAGGHTACPMGVCLQGASMCCNGCNLQQGTAYVCTIECPVPSTCIDGFCL